MVGWLKINNLTGKKDQPCPLPVCRDSESRQLFVSGNIRSALVTDVYTPAKDGEFSWEPSFVYHGFRYVEISGLDYQPELTAFTGRVIYDKMKRPDSSKRPTKIINQVFKMRSGVSAAIIVGMPTDCPQRDERRGWLGDRATGCFGEAFVLDKCLSV